jgi:hypothetical protein
MTTPDCRPASCFRWAAGGSFRLTVWAAMATAACLYGFAVLPAASAQEGELTEAIVRIPAAPNHEFDYAEVQVNGMEAKTGPGEETLFRLAAKRGDTLKVDIRLLLSASPAPVKEWHRTEELNGSGHVLYTAVLNGAGYFTQWPLVVLKGSVPLDVWIDHSVSGTTELSKGIAPGQEHTFEWKDGQFTVCSRKISLPANVTRTWTCNAATGSVDGR